MFRILAVGAAFGVLVVSGLVHGFMTGRWADREISAEFGRKLEGVPCTIGDYECQDQEMEVKPEDRVGAQLLRRYVHRNKTHSISVWVACGSPGPLSIHTPDWCYPASGYDLIAAKKVHALTLDEEGTKAQFWTADFRKVKPTGAEEVRVFWAWNAGGGWEAPESPRLQFSRASRLYKLYFVSSLESRKPLSDDDTTLEFMRRFLPEIDRIIQ